jgi:predicted N-acetyltransferase YhbS
MSLAAHITPPDRQFRQEGSREHPIEIRRERRADTVARERLLDTAFGAGRFAKSSERLREGRIPARGLAFSAFEGRDLVGTVRLWSVDAGPAHSCLLLGPLAVAANRRDRGIGADLMWRALHEARRLGHRAVLLVGDAAYYARFGFSAEQTSALRMPGPFERDRLLACELVPGALQGARGMISVHRPAPSRLAGIISGVGYGGPAVAEPA